MWYVIYSQDRPGSLDAAIDIATAVPNDFCRLYQEYPGIRRVCFNGKAAEALYRRLVAPGRENGSNSLEFSALPSTSPAYASMRFPEKLQRWRVVQAALNPTTGDPNWTFPVRTRVESSPVIAGNAAFLATSRGRIHAVDLATGKETWQFEAGGGFTASPAISNGRIVIGNTDGALYCFGKRD